jgi:hypothetical protein
MTDQNMKQSVNNYRIPQINNFAASGGAFNLPFYKFPNRLKNDGYWLTLKS